MLLSFEYSNVPSECIFRSSHIAPYVESTERTLHVDTLENRSDTTSIQRWKCRSPGYLCSEPQRQVFLPTRQPSYPWKKNSMVARPPQQSPPMQRMSFMSESKVSLTTFRHEPKVRSDEVKTTSKNCFGPLKCSRSITDVRRFLLRHRW